MKNMQSCRFCFLFSPRTSKTNAAPEDAAAPGPAAHRILQPRRRLLQVTAINLTLA